MKVEKMISKNPSTDEVIWEGYTSSESEVAEKLRTSSKAQKYWKTVSISEKRRIFEKFASLVKENAEEAARIISLENGKPFWEAKMEVNSLVNKVQVVFDAYDERASVKKKAMTNGRISVTRYLPHGIMAVLGPFNFPMSMPNSHIMPAIYAGNTVIFKPSERTPWSAQYYRDLWIQAGLPVDVLQIINGDAEIGEYLINSDGVNGVLFIGSRRAGKAIEAAMIQKDKICALEMGGNSPLVIWDYSDIRAAVNITIQSAYLSTGQRCSAARRLIVNSSIYDKFISTLRDAIMNIKVGDAFSDNPIPFMGPMIDQKAVEQYLMDYGNLIKSGAVVLSESKPLLSLGTNYVSPALLEVTDMPYWDKEIFGPLLQVIKVNTIEEAVMVSNKTEYGLAAGIVTENQSIYDYYLNNVYAGIINWNQPLTGSTTIAPFGGIKGSGNFRSAGFLSVDYCVYPVASIESDKAAVPASLSPGLEF